MRHQWLTYQLAAVSDGLETLAYRPCSRLMSPLPTSSYGVYPQNPRYAHFTCAYSAVVKGQQQLEAGRHNQESTDSTPAFGQLHIIVNAHTYPIRTRRQQYPNPETQTNIVKPTQSTSPPPSRASYAKHETRDNSSLLTYARPHMHTAPCSRSYNATRRPTRPTVQTTHRNIILLHLLLTICTRELFLHPLPQARSRPEC